jgi:hypothetical protein
MFRSKQHPEDEKDIIRDDKKPTRLHLKKVQRPCYSRYPGSWVVDHVFNLGRGFGWVWLINMNTRYLFVYPVTNTGAQGVLNAYYALSDHLKSIGVKGEYITNITGDGARAYVTHDLIAQLTLLGVTTYFSSSPYTNHNRILDRSVRTIRDAFAYRTEPGMNEVLAVVEMYNNTYNKAIDCTPKQMMLNPEWEWQYIRYCNEKVQDIKRNQEPYLHYKPGNVLFLHLDESKTEKKFAKKRRYWNNIGHFIKYIHGNVLVRLLQNNLIIELPIYFTKLCSESPIIPRNVLLEYGKFMA